VNPRIVKSERRRDASARGRHRAATYSALLVINALCDVRSSFIDAQQGTDVNRFLTTDGKRLRPEVESVVSELIDDVDRGSASDRLLAIVEGDCVMRLSPLIGSGDRVYALVIEADRNDDCIARAASRYRLTSRQIDALIHVIDGANAGEVAQALNISEYTAQGYIKTLLVKTDSRNRAALVAKVLDWEHARPSRDPAPAARRKARSA
jgi:DNA-binding CsgD family transcriptional regulator